MSKWLELKFAELEMAQSLTFEERDFICKVNNWEIKLKFWENTKMVAKVAKKQAVFLWIKDKNAMLGFINNKISNIKSEIDDHYTEVHICKETITKYLEIIKWIETV
jgi:hypothetical protein